MIDAIVLVPGVPALLLMMILALGRFEAAVAPELESDDSTEPGSVAATEPGGDDVVVERAGGDVAQRAGGREVAPVVRAATGRPWPGRAA